MITLRIEEDGIAVEVSRDTPRLLACSSGRQSIVGAIQSTVEALMWELAERWPRESGRHFDFIAFPVSGDPKNKS